MGGHSLRDTQTGPISYQSAKALTAHTKLKYRQKQQQIDYKQELLKREQEYKEKVLGIKVVVGDEYKELQNLDQDEEFDTESSESDDDDQQELLIELERIKKEREREKLELDLKLQQQKEEELKERSLVGNPLIINNNEMVFQEKKRRWDDDVIFKNQAKEIKPEKRFINDMLRSDFHRKFMDKYMK